MAIDPLNLAGTATQTFSDDFNALNLRAGNTGTWSTNYWWGAPNGTTLTNNGEQQWYVDSNFAGTQAVKPWTVSNGVLDITAQNAAPDIQSQINGYKYTSGMLTTHDSFAQTYGYFEMKAELPSGAGLWPAFWLLPASGGWPPEIDVMEQLGQDPNKYYTASHSQATGTGTSTGGVVDTPDLTAGYHTYGVDWEADKLTYYFDGKQAWQTDTPADMHDPMYMLVNLAVGGGWPGDPVADPNYSETLHVDYVHAYAAKAAGDVTAATPVVPDAVPTTPPPDPIVATTTPPAVETPVAAVVDTNVHATTPAVDTPHTPTDVVATTPVAATPAEIATPATPVADTAPPQTIEAHVDAPVITATPTVPDVTAPAVTTPAVAHTVTQTVDTTVPGDAFDFGAVTGTASQTPTTSTHHANGFHDVHDLQNGSGGSHDHGGRGSHDSHGQFDQQGLHDFMGSNDFTPVQADHLHTSHHHSWSF